MADNTRLNDLRRRVQADPASIAFAALAEEYRRVGKYQEAIDACIEGLKRHPSYLSAHVTLGRALLEVGRFEEAEQELQLVLKSAPENLAAIRGLAEIHHRRGDHGYDVAALSALHENAAAAEVQEAVPPSAVTEVPPPLAAPAHEPPGAFEPPELAGARYDTAASAAVVTEPPLLLKHPVVAQTSSYGVPRYDPPGTFELPQFSMPALMTPAPVPSIADREVEALERFLAAVVEAREAAPAP